MVESQLFHGTPEKGRPDPREISAASQWIIRSGMELYREAREGLNQ